jgi:hypothetical protein
VDWRDEMNLQREARKAGCIVGTIGLIVGLVIGFFFNEVMGIRARGAWSSAIRLALIEAFIGGVVGLVGGQLLGAYLSRRRYEGDDSPKASSKENTNGHFSATCGPKFQSTLVISCDEQTLYNHFRTYCVFVDGIEVALLKGREFVTIRVTPGQHRVEAKMDWCKSRAVNVEVESGECLRFQIGCYVRFPYLWRIILFPVYVIIPGWYLFVQRV